MIAPFSLIEVFNDESLNFRGNTAAVVRLKKVLNESQMQIIAEDFNQPATAFIWPSESSETSFNIRWYAPDSEIGLCGHGSLAAIASLVEGKFQAKEIEFHYNGGTITACRHESFSASITLSEIATTRSLPIRPELEEAFGVKILEHFKSSNKDILVVSSEDDLRTMEPDFQALRKFKSFGYALTAKGNKSDFVSRTIVPFVKVLEDEATGSSHAILTPFWSKRLDKKELLAYQLGSRGGKFLCQLNAKTVKLTGNYKVFAEGQLSIKG